MTFRALLISLFSVLFICGIGYINDFVLKLESISNGHQIPILVIGVMVVFVMAINPLLKRINGKLALTAAELAVIFTISTCAVGIPGRALMEQFAQIVVMPYYWDRVTPGYHSKDMLSYYPKGTLVDPEPQDEVVNRFITGSDKPKVPPATLREWLELKLGQVPWKQWMPPLKTWLPFIFLTTIAMACLALILHRQWSDHEHLQYPIANFAESIIKQTPGKCFNETFHNRLFWIGFSIILLIRVNNGLCKWFPDVLIPVKMTHPLWAFASRWPQLNRNPWAYGLMVLDIFPLVIAFAFFLSSEISFALGISQILWAAFCIPVIGMGINLNTDYDIGGWQGWNRVGSYLAFGLIMFYAGRHYYLHLMKKAFFLDRLPWLRDPSAETNETASSPGAANAMRILFVTLFLLCALAIRMGLSWPIAVGTILLMILTFVITARISAETGLFFIQPGWQPIGALMALFGSYALSPSNIFLSALLCAVLCIDQSQALLPYLINGLKLGASARVEPRKLTHVNCLFYFVGIIVAIFITVTVIYDYGIDADYWWSYHRMPTIAIRATEPALLQLNASGNLEESESLTGLQRIFRMQPQPAFLWAAGIGFFGVILLSFLRLHLRWWPLHPCFFLVWATFPMCIFSHNFLLGWFIKKMVLRFGGNKLVVKLKPLAIGIITADILGALIFMLVGAIYYFTTGLRPENYRYFPR